MKTVSLLLVILTVSYLGLLVCPLEAQSFPGQGDDYTRTYGKIYLYVAPDFRDLLSGYPGFDPKARRLVSPALYDGGTTIGRSAPHTDGSKEDTHGTKVGSANTVVADIDFWIMPKEFQGPAGTREIHTELRSLRMQMYTTGMAIRAGIHAKDRPPSFGEIQSKSGNSKDPQKDFPARSFFNVFAEVDIPNLGGKSMVTLYNKKAMLLTDDNITSFPPSTVYRHCSSSAVEICFKDDNPGKWKKDDILGFLVLAGHGVKVSVNPFTKKVESWSENPLAVQPWPSGTVTPVQDRMKGEGKVLVLNEQNNTVTTVLHPLTGPRTGWYPSQVMMGPFNKDIWLTYLDRYSRTSEIHILDMCGIRASTRPLKWAPYGFWRSEENGIYWVMRDAQYADKIFHTDWSAEQKSLTTVFSKDIPDDLVALCEHEDTGYYVGVSSHSSPMGALSLLDFKNRSVVRWIYGFGRLSGAAFNKGDGSVYAVESGVPGAGKLYKVDMMSGTFTTLIKYGVDEISSISYNLDHTLTLGACHELHKFDPVRNAILNTWKFGANRYQAIQSAVPFAASPLTFDLSQGKYSVIRYSISA